MRTPPAVGLVAILFSASVMADGGLIPYPYDAPVSEPEQQAVILWDGGKETLVLSTKIKSAESFDLVWLIPIESSTKPEVTSSDMRVYSKFNDFFREKYRDYGTLGTLGSMQPTAGVEVVEQKEIDLYDLTTLRAQSAESLIDWLNDNGYSISQDAANVLKKYVGTEHYFIANKIDLSNWHEEAMAAVDEHESSITSACSYYGGWRNWGLGLEEEFAMEKLCDHISRLEYGGMETPLKIEFTPDKPQFPLEISSINQGHTYITVYVAAMEPMVDSRGMLELEDSKRITPEFREGLLGTMDIGDLAYATKSTYSGDLRHLNNDAVFRPEPSLIEIDWASYILIVGAILLLILLFIIQRRTSKTD